MEFLIQETLDSEPLTHIIQIPGNKRNFTFDIGNLTIIRKSLIISIVLNVLNLFKKQNTRKTIEILELQSPKVSIFSFETLDLSNSLRKSMPLNYTINITLETSYKAYYLSRNF